MNQVRQKFSIRQMLQSVTKALRSLHALVLLFVAILILVACANIGSPDGGPYDETPPKVVHTSPKFGATNEKNVKKITIEFDEIVKVDNPSERVVISPPQIQQPEIEAIGRRITIALLDSLKPDMTYTIDFADAMKEPLRLFFRILGLDTLRICDKKVAKCFGFGWVFPLTDGAGVCKINMIG